MEANRAAALRRVAGLLAGPYRASLPRTALAAARGVRPMIVSPGFRIAGAGRISAAGLVKLGTRDYGFTDARMDGLLRVRGRLEFRGGAEIGKGARWDVGPGATVTIGAGTYFSPRSLLIASIGITVGADCAIAWDVQILDDDFHTLVVAGEQRPSTLPVEIGDHVWIGNRSLVLKGARIPRGCVVAANSVVTGRFDEENCLLAGSPARVVKRDVVWDPAADEVGAPPLPAVSAR
ncbi:hypothetical protein GCM10009836_46430 [Pseudonocardia ailaonensis]|uniref:Acyltransferase n=1 Tax=Pseudonocardia ailaonensis TaxID=367279 RepID=A0ABN2NB29_9PSEU